MYNQPMRLIILILIAALCIGGASFADPLLMADNIQPPKGYGKPHGASLVELDNGDILATWFSSQKETDRGAVIFGAEWSKSSGQWDKPRIIIPSDYTKSLGNTALFKDDDGVIWLFFAAVRIGGWSGAMVDYVVSRDDGKTWSDGKNLVFYPGNLPRNIPIKVGDHQMLVPLFIDFWYEMNLVGSYTALITYKDGKVIEKHYASVDDFDAIQPTVVKLPDGKILLLARDKSDQFVRKSYSNNNGKSWEPATITQVPNPGAAISAIYIDEMKTVLLAYNHSQKARNPLSLAISEDGGESFIRVTDLENKPGDQSASFSYPALIRTSDGMIHAIWSHDNRATLKHVRFNIDWLKEKIEVSQN